MQCVHQEFATIRRCGRHCIAALDGGAQQLVRLATMLALFPQLLHASLQFEEGANYMPNCNSTIHMYEGDRMNALLLYTCTYCWY